jgi:hypothetical protein
MVTYSKEKIDALIQLIEKEANRETFYDDNEYGDIYDASGGNADDAYSIGEEDGKTYFARELRSFLKNFNN